MSGSNGAGCGTGLKSGPVERDKRGSRRMALLKRIGLFNNDTQGAKITRATSIEDFIEAYRLVHDIFVQQGYIHPDETGIRVRPFEALPVTATFIAKAGNEVVGVTSVVVDSPKLGLPSNGAFRDVIDTLRAEGRLICEATNEAVDKAYRKTPVTTELMRCCFAHAVSIGCTDFLGTVNPGHAKFYSLMGFEQIGDVRSYSRDIEDPVVLVRMDLDTIAQRAAVAETGNREDDAFFKGYYLDDNPYHQYVKTWQIMSDRFFTDPTMLTELFVHSSGLLERCSEVELDAIRGQWGDELFAEVMARTPAAVAL